MFELSNIQKEIVEFLHKNRNHSVGIEAPTGCGKTIAYLSYVMSIPEKIIISTYTKALQEQVAGELENIFGFKDYIVLQGKKNYKCTDKIKSLEKEKQELAFYMNPAIPTLDVSVSSEYCRPDYTCEYRDECGYLLTLDQAKRSKVVIVNHALLLSYVRRITENTVVIIDECHYLEQVLKRKIEVNEEDLKEIPAPDPKDYKTIQEFNRAVEKYLQHKKKLETIRSLEITSPGKYQYKVDLDLSHVKKVIYVSATFPLLEVEDMFVVGDKRDWTRVKFNIGNVNYRQSHYMFVLTKTILEAIEKYPVVLVLATSYEQMRALKKTFPYAVTTEEKKPFEIIKEIQAGNVRLAVGCDTFWTGIDVPGKKGIVMTKLPFPHVDGKEMDFNLSLQKMIVKFKQGIGRMIRSPECEGEIWLLDNRQYPEVDAVLEEFRQKGMQIECVKKGEKVDYL